MTGDEEEARDNDGAEALPEAERYARSRRVSLSPPIERSRPEATGEDTPTFASRRRGRLEAACRDEARYDALARKYL